MGSVQLLVDLQTDRVVQSDTGEVSDDALADALGITVAELRRRRTSGVIFCGSVPETWRYVLRHRPGLRFEVAGNSMVPTLVRGDLVVIRSDTGRIDRGAVVLAVLQGRIVVHRVVETNDVFVVLRGDNSPGCDPPIPLHDVIGVAVAKERRLRPRLIALNFYLRRRKWYRLSPILWRSFTRRLY